MGAPVTVCDNAVRKGDHQLADPVGNINLKPPVHRVRHLDERLV